MKGEKTDELNKKLTEWAGFKKTDYKWKPNEPEPYIWTDHDGHISGEPQFTQSLDACFEWLVPLAINKIMAQRGDSSDVAYAILFKKWLQELELIIPDAALALCLAIEKLIDSELSGKRRKE